MVSVRALLMGPGFGNEHPVVRGAGGLGLSLVSVAWAQFPLQRQCFPYPTTFFVFRMPFCLHSGFYYALWYRNYGPSLMKFSSNPAWLGCEASAFSEKEKENILSKKIPEFV